VVKRGVGVSSSISKSRFINGLQCEKRLWLEIHEHGLADEIDEGTQAIFDQGRLVGELAQKLYPEGVLICEDHLHIAEAVQSTEKAAKAGAQTLYEAGGVYGRFLCRADILKRVKSEADEWDLIEVKSSTGVKDVYLYDMAIQKYVFEGCGYPIRKSILCMLNKEYVRKGGLEVQKLFTLADVTGAVGRLMKKIPEMAERFEKTADLEKAPEVPIGRRCGDPYECSFRGHCWKDVPEDSVFTMAGRKEFAEDLYQRGIIRLVDIPEWVKLTAKQKKQLEVAKDGRPFWKQTAIQAFLKTLEYPMSFLDFESFMLAIPPYDGTKPYQHIPFQFSLHVVKKEGEKPEHFEFLGDGKGDPRRGFVEALGRQMPDQGSVLAYSPYESRVLKEMGFFLLEYKNKLNGIIKRITDLSVPFRNQDVLVPTFRGSYSLKHVLPALVPDMTYEGMEIGEGGAASLAYVRLMDGGMPKGESEKIRKGLLAYCGQDTLAMVRLLEVLQKV
jgi:hypothetical protein